MSIHTHLCSIKYLTSFGTVLKTSVDFEEEEKGVKSEIKNRRRLNVDVIFNNFVVIAYSLHTITLYQYMCENDTS